MLAKPDEVKQSGKLAKGVLFHEENAHAHKSIVALGAKSRE